MISLWGMLAEGYWSDRYPNKPALMLHMAPNMDNCIHIKPETAWEVILEQNDSIVHVFF